MLLRRTLGLECLRQQKPQRKPFVLDEWVPLKAHKLRYSEQGKPLKTISHKPQNLNPKAQTPKR